MTYVPPKIEAVNYAAPATALAARPISSLSDLIFHHTAGPTSQGPLDIDREHRDEGWAGIGYHFVVGRDGKIYTGRPVMYVPAAAYGRNAESINVCLVGNFQSDDAGFNGDPTPAQIVSAKALALYLHKVYPSIVRTIGHRDVATLFHKGNEADYATACPGDRFMAHLPEIKQYVLANMKAT